MLTAILRRLSLSLLTLLLCALLVFVATEVLPGDALDVFLTEDDLLAMTAEDVEVLRREFGLDRPAPVRFLEWISGAIVGDFGVTLIDKVPIMDVIWHPMLNSLQLGIVITQKKRDGDQANGRHPLVQLREEPA